MAPRPCAVSAYKLCSGVVCEAPVLRAQTIDCLRHTELMLHAAFVLYVARRFFRVAYGMLDVGAAARDLCGGGVRDSAGLAVGLDCDAPDEIARERSRQLHLVPCGCFPGTVAHR